MIGLVLDYDEQMIATGEYFSEVYAEFNMLQCINGFIGNKSKSYPHRDSIFVCRNRETKLVILMP